MFKRIRDWWTRPSWEEYLAEHQACVDSLAREDDLKDKLAFNANANSCMSMKIFDLKSEIDHLKSDLNVARDEAAEIKGEYDDLGMGLTAAKRELDRLRKLGIESCENAPVDSIDIEGGAIEVALRPPHWAIKAMAASFAETLDGAANWRSIEVGPVLSGDGWLIVTVCRKSGDSPVETVGKLKDMISELLSLDGGSVYHPPGGPAEDIFRRARALLNPEKKDS